MGRGFSLKYRAIASTPFSQTARGGRSSGLPSNLKSVSAVSWPKLSGSAVSWFSCLEWAACAVLRIRAPSYEHTRHTRARACALSARSSPCIASRMPRNATSQPTRSRKRSAVTGTAASAPSAGRSSPAAPSACCCTCAQMGGNQDEHSHKRQNPVYFKSYYTSKVLLQKPIALSGFSEAWNPLCTARPAHNSTRSAPHVRASAPL